MKVSGLRTDQPRHEPAAASGQRLAPLAGLNQSPRMLEQRRVLQAALGGLFRPPVIQQTKEQHAAGDLHYGVSDPRYAGMTAMNLEDPAATPAPVDDPGTVDQLNEDSGITHLFKESMADDYVYGYFQVVNTLAARPNPAVAAPVLPQRWLDFLKRNIDYLKLDHQVNQIKAGGAAVPTKDKLSKNGPAPTAGQSVGGKKDAVVEAFDWGSVQFLSDPSYAGAVNGWIWDAFFRRTSKLGIKFAVEEGKVVHFNTDAPGNVLKGRADSQVDIDAAAPARSRQPITHSEMRFINRTGLLAGPHVDAYAGAAQVNAPRTGLEGRMDGYVDARRLAGKVVPKPL